MNDGKASLQKRHFRRSFSSHVFKCLHNDDLRWYFFSLFSHTNRFPGRGTGSFIPREFRRAPADGLGSFQFGVSAELCVAAFEAVWDLSVLIPVRDVELSLDVPSLPFPCAGRLPRAPACSEVGELGPTLDRGCFTLSKPTILRGIVRRGW